MAKIILRRVQTEVYRLLSKKLSKNTTLLPSAEGLRPQGRKHTRIQHRKVDFAGLGFSAADPLRAGMRST